MIVARDYRGEWSTDVGGRTRSRLKVKGRHESRFVVIGLDVPLAGACSLLLASRQGRRLVYVGQVRWGVSRAVVAAIRDRCVTRGTPACSGAETRAGLVWIEPAAAAPQLGVNPRTAISFPALGIDRRDLEAQPVVRLRPRRRRTPLRA